MATRRVRIAVLIDQGGDWAAFGASRSDDREMADECYRIGIDHDGESHIVFVEADVPEPERITVEGAARSTDREGDDGR